MLFISTLCMVITGCTKKTLSEQAHGIIKNDVDKVESTLEIQETSTTAAAIVEDNFTTTFETETATIEDTTIENTTTEVMETEPPATEPTTTESATTESATTVPAATVEITETTEALNTYIIYSKNVVNIRAKASTKSEIIGQTVKGQELLCTGETGDWYIVLYNGKKAYVSAKYFSKTPILIADNTKDDPYTYEDMQSAITNLKATYTENFDVEVLGKSYDERDIYLLTLGNPDAPKSVLFTASIHGAEYITSQLVMAQAEYYLANASEEYDGKKISEILKDVCVYIMPMVNPDSVVINQYGFSAINDEDLRNKLYTIGYTNKWSANARGVDINRNFPTEGYCVENADGQGENKPAYKYYPGEYAASEVETQIIIDFVNAHPTLMAFVSYHSKGEVIYWNKGQTGTLYKNNQKMVKLIASLTGYKNITYLQTKSGIDYEWAVLEAGLAGCTIEVGDIESWFPVRQTQWKDIWKRNKYVMLAVADLFEELKK